jgi:hypothetical protein
MKLNFLPRLMLPALACIAATNALARPIKIPPPTVLDTLWSVFTGLLAAL